MSETTNDRNHDDGEDRNDLPWLINRRQFVWITAGGIAGVALAACGGGDDDSTDSATDDGGTDGGDSGDTGSDESTSEAPNGGASGTLRVAFPESPNEFDPALYSAFPEYNTGYAVYDGLVRVDDGLIPQPALATAWDVAADGLTWTFTIREGVAFHHGKALTAEDVAHTFNRLIDPDVASPLGAALAIVDSVEAVDDTTAVFNLNSANGDLALLCGSPQARIVPADLSQDELRANPSGTGPFAFVSHVAGERTSFAANPDYWGDGPFVESLEFVAMPESSTQVAALSGGQIDMMWQAGTENLAALDSASDVEVLQVASGAYQTVAMQSDVAPFDDSRVREAVRKCVDRNGMVAIALEDIGDPGNDHPFPVFSPFLADIPLKEPDIEGAKALLADAGYPDGIDLTLTTSEVRAGMVPLATALQEMCRPAGINIELDVAPPDNYWSEVWLNRPFFCSNWGFRPSIDETLSLQFVTDGKWNEGRYGTAEIDAAVAAGRAASDPAERSTQYEVVQRGLNGEGGAVVVPYFRPVIQARTTAVQGYVPHPAQWMYLDTVSLA